jgi:Ca2+/Na+ antiporter
LLGRGVLMVFGKQRFVMVSSSLASYGVGLPVLLYVVYRTHLKTGGIVLAVVLEKLVQVLAYSFRSGRLDVEQEIVECHERLKEGFQGGGEKRYGTIQHNEEEEEEYKGSLRNILISFLLATISLAVFGTLSFIF